MRDEIKADINSVPLDAPLEIQEPSQKWINARSRDGVTSEKVEAPKADLTGKWIIVTGGNSGIGREAALQLAAWGGNVFIAARENSPSHEPHPSVVVEELEDTARKSGHSNSEMGWYHVDYADFKSVEALAREWLDTGRPLDALANNIGIGSSPSGAAVTKTKDGFEVYHQVNFLSHVLLTLLLLPSLAKAQAPRITCTVSSMHYHGEFDLRNCNGELNRPGRDGVAFYQNNKLWFLIWLAELQRRLLLTKEYKHITINGVHPGYVNSEIWNFAFQGWLAPFKILFWKTLANIFAVSSQQGSICIVHGITAVETGPDPDLQGIGEKGGRGGGKYFSRTKYVEPMPHVRDADCRQRVWRKTNEELNLQERGLLSVLGLDYELR